jgi:hypothetical protein
LETPRSGRHNIVRSVAVSTAAMSSQLGGVGMAHAGVASPRPRNGASLKSPTATRVRGGATVAAANSTRAALYPLRRPSLPSCAARGDAVHRSPVLGRRVTRHNLVTRAAADDDDEKQASAMPPPMPKGAEAGAHTRSLQSST